MEKLAAIIILITIFGIGASFGYISRNQIAINRHEELLNDHKRKFYNYDRLDLHYLTFGDKIK